MRVLAWSIAVGLFACGDVAVKVDGGKSDAPDPDALSCPATQLACGSSCIDPMTTAEHCGTCENACQTTGSMCMAGHCVDNITSCAQIHMLNSAAASGFYTFIDGTQIFCDMVAVKGYEGPVIMALFNAPPTDYSIITAPDLQNAGTVAAFIALYNNGGGMKVLANFNSGNCCFINDAATNTMLFLQGADVYPAAASAKQCSTGYVTTTTYQFAMLPDTATPVYANVPLAATFFTTNAPTATVGCGVNNNPAVMWKVKP
jgi:hypothetical protein